MHGTFLIYVKDGERASLGLWDADIFSLLLLRFLLGLLGLLNLYFLAFILSAFADGFTVLLFNCSATIDALFFADGCFSDNG